MSKIIIQNDSSFPDDDVIGLISLVIEGGYCYVTTWASIGVAVYAMKNEKSYRFIVQNLKE